MVFTEVKDKFSFLRTAKFFKEFKDEWEACHYHTKGFEARSFYGLTTTHPTVSMHLPD